MAPRTQRRAHSTQRLEAHKRYKCRDAGIVDASLTIPVKPLVFETFGAAGPAMLELTRQARRHFSAQRLDLDNPSAEAFSTPHGRTRSPSL